MRHFRVLTLLTGCFLMGSAALADDQGFVDCTTHPDPTPVFSKARQTQDSLGTVACGEHFTVLVYGFIYSRVQTKDGKVGYVLSSLISVDRGGNTGQQSSSTSTQSLQSASMREPVAATPAATNAVTKPAVPARSVASNPPASAQPQPAAQAAPAQVTAAPQPAPAPATSSPATAAEVQATASTDSQPAAAQPAATPTLPSAAQVEAATSASAVQPDSSGPDPAPTSASEPAAAQPVAAPASQPEPQPQPASAQPAAAEPVRSSSSRSSWEKPLPAGRQKFLMEVFGGYSFDRMTMSSPSYSSNMNGGMGSVGYNFRPWLQLVGDSSYNFVTTSGTKYVLWGNHFGGRYFYRRHNRWALTPFVEGLIGGSRFDTTVSGVGGSKTSQNCISYRAGGGVDFHWGGRWEVRLINVDYYRTSFSVNGVSATQNNYWASAGVVLRLFGSPAID